MAFPQIESSERGLNQRYPIGMSLKYTLLRDGRVVTSGEGRTLNVSSGGALIKFEAVLAARLGLPTRLVTQTRLVLGDT